MNDWMYRTQFCLMYLLTFPMSIFPSFSLLFPPRNPPNNSKKRTSLTQKSLHLHLHSEFPGVLEGRSERPASMTPWNRHRTPTPDSWIWSTKSDQWVAWKKNWCLNLFEAIFFTESMKVDRKTKGSPFLKEWEGAHLSHLCICSGKTHTSKWVGGEYGTAYRKAPRRFFFEASLVQGMVLWALPWQEMIWGQP